MTIVDLVVSGASPNSASATRRPSMTLRHHHAAAAPHPAPPAAPRLSVVDPNTVARAGLPLVLTGFTIAGSFATTDALLASRPQADIVLLEVGDAEICNDAPVRALSRAGYRVCLYTFERRPAVIAHYIAAGARGVVSKSAPLDSLSHALSRIAAGGTAISGGFTSADTVDLTLRQLQILAGRARGETFHSIARRLEISERTAQDHWSAVARRFATFLRSHSPADLERSLGLDNGAAPLDGETR